MSHDNCEHRPCGEAEIHRLRSEVERLRAERDEARADYERARADFLRCAETQRAAFSDAAKAEAEVVRLTRENERLATGRTIEGDGVTDVDLLRAEVKRLRGLIAEAEWVSGGYIMGPPSCPWCAYPVKEDGHSPQCPAFSARGEVRR